MTLFRVKKRMMTPPQGKELDTPCPLLYSLAMLKRTAALCIALLLNACGEGDSPAVPETAAQMYEQARRLLQPGVEQNESDFAGALEWLKKAAQAGYLQAQTDLAGIYLEGGKGVQANAQEAYRWFCKAAEQGSREADVFIGALLYEGKGVAKDVTAALVHWRRAAEAGIPEAQYRLGHCLAQTEEGVQEGAEWLKKAALAGGGRAVAAAARDLGYLLIEGSHGIPANRQEAARWYALAAEGGDASSRYVYALMLMTGDSMPQDTEAGLAQLRIAAGQDYAPAIAALIRALRSGENAAASEQEAAAWSHRLEELLNRQPADSNQ